jgi:hypothetical protein
LCFHAHLAYHRRTRLCCTKHTTCQVTKSST